MPKDEIKNLLTRGVTDVIVRDDLEKKLQSGKSLRIKLGIDPTGTDLTLGHAVVFRKLKQFQDLGHTVIFLFGGYTATIGDPTGKNETRPVLTEEEVEKNAQTYLEQAGKILNIEKCEIRNNKEWLKNMSLADGLSLMSKKSAQQILARKDFKERFKKEVDIHLQEFVYPMLQGYDSVVLESDVEIGGNDQLFNVLVGRDLQKKYGCKTTQNILTTKILLGTDGVEKMSKSLGNYISLNDEPNEKFGKIMSLPDEAMLDYFECLTDVDLSQIEQEIKESPKNTKGKLAKIIIEWIDGKEAADKAEEEFKRVFSQKGLPDDMPEISLAKGKYSILTLVIESKLCSSNGEARRMIQQGAVKINEEKKADLEDEIEIGNDDVILQIGKRKFAKISSI